MVIDAHHHLWDLNAVRYTWLMERGVKRFFGDPTSIQRDYLLAEHRALAAPHGVNASVHIQVGVVDALEEAQWVDTVAAASPDWPMKQVVFCDLTSADRSAQLDAFQKLPSVIGVRQILGRSAAEDAKTGTNALIDNPSFLDGLHDVADRGLRFDLQLTPPLIEAAGELFAKVPHLPVALCHAGSPHDRSIDGLEAWAKALPQLATLPNMVCKLSGLGMFDHGWQDDAFRPIADTCLATFGAQRTMFGSNFPVCSLTSDYKTLFEAIRDLVPAPDRQQVFHDTAHAFYF